MKPASGDDRWFLLWPCTGYVCCGIGCCICYEVHSMNWLLHLLLLG